MSASVKSGYDGVQRKSPIFHRRTQDFVRRLGWRYLRNLAAYRPELYAPAAAEVLIAYTPDDAEEPTGLRGAFARCYLLHRILWGASGRFVLDDRRLTFRFRNAAVDQPSPRRPRGGVPAPLGRPARRLPARPVRRTAAGGPRLRRAGRRGAAPEGARRGRPEHRPATPAAPYEPTVQLGLEELERRFDPDRPDLHLLEVLLSDELPRARELGRRWLRLAAPFWTRDRERVLVFLALPDAETVALAAELAADRLRADPEMRRVLAAWLLARLRAPEAGPGTHDVYARIARESLAEEMGALLNVSDLVAMVNDGTPPVQAMAGALLARRPEALAHLGLEGLAALAGHEVAAVRAAAHALMRAAAHTVPLRSRSVVPADRERLGRHPRRGVRLAPQPGRPGDARARRADGPARLEPPRRAGLRQGPGEAAPRPVGPARARRPPGRAPAPEHATVRAGPGGRAPARRRRGRSPGSNGSCARRSSTSGPIGW